MDMSKSPLLQKMAPDSINEIDFVMGPNETNVAYSERIGQEFSNPLDENRFITIDDGGEAYLAISGPEFFHLVYGIVFHMTGKY